MHLEVSWQKPPCMTQATTRLLPGLDPEATGDQSFLHDVISPTNTPPLRLG